MRRAILRSREPSPGVSANAHTTRADHGAAAAVELAHPEWFEYDGTCGPRATCAPLSRMTISDFDLGIMAWITGSSLHGPVVDAVLLEMGDNDVIKGFLPVALLFWYWHRPGPDLARHRELVVSAAAGALLAAAASRGLANLLPYRPRPFQVPGLHLAIPPESLWEIKGGSFPSDTAAITFGMVGGVLLLEPVAGLVLAVGAALLVAFPRAYLGIHWTTDLIGGAVLGLAVTGTLSRPAIRRPLARWPLRLHATAPHWFYALVFFLGHGLMTRFDDARQILRWIRTMLHCAW